ncbi:MAG: hypothetical protein IJT01_05125, partial [Selenomonadaceae bacterium]|nr:hypothetical protein [Selenomonadaceae bacterium]
EQGKEVVCWVDRQAESMQGHGLPVEPVERLRQGGFEQVVIAVKDKEKAREIRGTIMGMGIAEKDIWRDC